MLTNFRTSEYGIWRACERFGIMPPGVESHWDGNTNWAKAMLLAFAQIRETEDAKFDAALHGAE